MADFWDFVVGMWDASPSIVHGLLVLIAGWVVALAVRALVRGILMLFRFDSFADKVGLGEFLKNGRVQHRPSKLVAMFAYQLVLLGTFLIASRALDIAAVTSITDKLFDYLPSVAAAIFVAVIGWMVVSFLCNVIETIARNTALTNVRAVVATFRYIGFAVILLLASDQLGFGKSLLSQLLVIAFAALCLGLAIAFGFGSVDLARGAVQGFLKNLDKKRGADKEDEEGPEDEDRDKPD